MRAYVNAPNSSGPPEVVNLILTKKDIVVMTKEERVKIKKQIARIYRTEEEFDKILFEGECPGCNRLVDLEDHDDDCEEG